MEKEVRENRAVAQAGRSGGEEECSDSDGGNEGGRDIIKTKAQAKALPLAQSCLNLCSYALPIQILRLLVHGDFSHSSESAYGSGERGLNCEDIGDDSDSDSETVDSGEEIRCEGGDDGDCSRNAVRRFSARRVGKSVERLCIDLEHEGLRLAALEEAKRGLEDKDVQVTFFRSAFYFATVLLEFKWRRLLFVISSTFY